MRLATQGYRGRALLAPRSLVDLNAGSISHDQRLPLNGRRCNKTPIFTLMFDNYENGALPNHPTGGRASARLVAHPHRTMSAQSTSEQAPMATSSCPGEGCAPAKGPLSWPAERFSEEAPIARTRRPPRAAWTGCLVLFPWKGPCFLLAASVPQMV